LFHAGESTADLENSQVFAEPANFARSLLSENPASYPNSWIPTVRELFGLSD